MISFKNRFILIALGTLSVIGCSGDYTEEVEALNVQMKILSKNSPLVKVSLIRREKEVTNDGEGLQIFGTTERCEINTYSTSFLYDVSKDEIISIEEIENQDDSLGLGIDYSVPFYFNDTMLFVLQEGGAGYIDSGRIKNYIGIDIKKTEGLSYLVGSSCYSADYRFESQFIYIKPKVCHPNWLIKNFESGERNNFIENSNITTPLSRCERFLKAQKGENLGMLYFEKAYYGYLLDGDTVIACIHNDERLIDSTFFESEFISSLNEVRYVDGKVFGFDSLGNCKQLEQKSVSEFKVLSNECDIYDSRLAWESKAVVFDSVTKVKQIIPKELEFWESRIKTNLKYIGREACD
jgi:hypothetical protein